MLLTRGFWELDYASRDVDMTLVSEVTVKGEAIHEVQSDDCLTEFFGTRYKPIK